MATKKSLSDLLREEATKTTPARQKDGAGAKKATSSEPTASKKAATSQKPPAKAAKKASTQSTPSATTKQTPAKSTASAKQSTGAARKSTGTATRKISKSSSASKKTAAQSTTTQNKAKATPTAKKTTAKSTAATQDASKATSRSAARPKSSTGSKPLTTSQTRQAAQHASSNPAQRTTQPTKADLEAQVGELTQTLKAAHSKETALHKKVTHLESLLAEQKLALQALEGAVKQTDTLKEKLEQTTKDAVRLAQENDRLQQQLAAEQTAQPRKTPAKKSSALATAQKHTTRTRSIFHRPIRSNQTGTNKSFDTWCYD